MVKSRKGGVRINLHGFKSDVLACARNDCRPSTWYDLGMADRVSAEFIAHNYANGINVYDTKTIIEVAYGIKCILMEYTVSSNKKIVADLTLRLSNDQAVLARCDIGANNGHAFIIYKEKDELFVRDSQSGRLKIPIIDYFKDLGAINFTVIFSEQGESIESNDPPRITKELIIDLYSSGRIKRPIYEDRKGSWRSAEEPPYGWEKSRDTAAHRAYLLAEQESIASSGIVPPFYDFQEM
jgi:hypothetical protein